jgi:hypothetical protein
VVVEESAVVVAEAEDDDDDDDLAFLDDLPDPEKATEQRALLASFESAKKNDDVSCARAQAEEEQLCSTLDLSVQRAPTEGAVCRLFAEERQRLLEDAAEVEISLRASGGSSGA